MPAAESRLAIKKFQRLQVHAGGGQAGTVNHVHQFLGGNFCALVESPHGAVLFDIIFQHGTPPVISHNIFLLMIVIYLAYVK